jgi:hypothetical protein
MTDPPSVIFFDKFINNCSFLDNFIPEQHKRESLDSQKEEG